ncbi:hypothetical protein PXD04_08845 [Methanosphaera sp. ISO3-F5]|uniref:hypothetical protein n=1 Tax=Methanosphaera sp. ISO3-F5 TaxID=1452353 RepID=UPI002B2571BD|nr:hypothetical protein [Methanosphaera sp. ISO3-F5]WQH63797.1 hypothetical protein PXD04_08845 [Methanosphaera sp. ISO3-F5]
MVCEINYEHEKSLSDYIKSLCEVENVEVIFECVRMLKEDKSLEEIKELNDEEMFNYYVKAEKKVSE